VLDHAGKPPIARRDLAHWERQLRRLAAYEQVVCTLAGGWDRWAATVEELLSGCSPDETDAVLSGTARSFYQLSAVPKGS
jgi:L-fuconolactonase